MPFSQWRIQDFREWVAGVELRMREETEDRGAVGADNNNNNNNNQYIYKQRQSHAMSQQFF